MSPVKLTVIEGGRDKLEASLARALFGNSVEEIDRISEQLNSIQKEHPSRLELVKTPKQQPSNT